MARGPDAPGHASAIPPTWRLAEALVRHPGLRVLPSRTSDVRLEGEVRCYRVGPENVLIDERYAVTLEVPRTFPRALPRVVETQGRVPRTFHRNPDDSLCLGSPIAQLFAIEDEPTIGGFIDRVLVPYLYSHAFHERFGRAPFGELVHGAAGLEEDVRRLFGLRSGTDVEQFLRLAGLKRRQANKQPCPCGSAWRLGRCHFGVVHRARRRLGRSTCREQRLYLAQQRSAESSNRHTSMATNPPKGDGHRNGAVRDRSQVQNPQNGNWTKRDTHTGRFIDQKQDGKPFKGVRKEK